MRRSATSLLRPLLLTCVLTFAAGPMVANAQLVRAYVVEDSVTVGDHFTLVLVAEHSQADSVVFPEDLSEIGKDGYPIGDLIALKLRSGGRRFLGVGHRYLLADSIAIEATTFAIDTALVASIPVSFISAQRTTSRQSDPFEIIVTTVLPSDASELKDIEPLAQFPRSPLPFIILGVGLILGFILYRWLSKRKPKEIVAPPPPVRRPPPRQIESPLAEANRRLEALDASDISDEAAIKPYFVELSEILRNYIERRLHVSALESTSAELLQTMRAYLPRTPIPADVVTDLAAILETADLAKFADVKHPEELCRATLSENRILIMRIEDSFRPSRPDESTVRAEPAESSPPPIVIPTTLVTDEEIVTVAMDSKPDWATGEGGVEKLGVDLDRNEAEIDASELDVVDEWERNAPGAALPTPSNETEGGAS